MGGIVDGGAGIGIKTSPRRAAIEKAQAELRQEYDVREKRRRELEFLEKGGNPLDFNFGNAASVSVQSTSLVDRHKEQFFSGEAKVSLALTASTHGDSIESSGRPGVPTICEHNSADSHLQCDGGNEMRESDKKSVRVDRKNFIVRPDQSLKKDSNRSAKESEDSAIFRPYARRNRSRLNRDGGRSSSTDLINNRTSQGSSLPTRTGINNSRVSTLDSSDQKDPNGCSVSQAELPDNNNEMLSKSVTPETQMDGLALESSMSLKKSESSEVRLDTVTRANQEPLPLSNAQETSVDVPCQGISPNRAEEGEVSGGACNLPSVASMKADPEISCHMNRLGETVVNDKTTVNEALNSSAAANSKVLDSESSCACSMEEVQIDPMNIDHGNVRVEKPESAGAEKAASGEIVDGQNDNDTLKGGADGEKEDTFSKQNCMDNVKRDQDEDALHSNSILDNGEPIPVEPKREETELLADNTNLNQGICSDVKPNESTEAVVSEISKSTPIARDEVTGLEGPSADNHSRLAAIAYEDSVLEEAKIIEAKRKRIAELSMGTVAFEERHQSQWEFVLEEMAWLANDFAQERLWKITAASQLCRRAASVSHLRLEEQSKQMNPRKVAFTLAKAVMQFWQSLDENLDVVDDDGSSNQKVVMDEASGSVRNIDSELSAGKTDSDMGKVSSNDMSLQTQRKHPLLVRSYAVRFLRQTNSHVPLFLELPENQNVTSDSDSLQAPLGDHFTEENLFYTIPSGAMVTYRKLIESYISQHEGAGIIPDVDTHMLDVGDYGYPENAYNEGEGETSTYYLPGAFEGSKSLKFSQKKRKNLNRPSELEADSPYGRCSIGIQQPMGKRPANLVGHIPTKRFRSASRPRVIVPSATSVGSFQAPTKTDASSGDTNSFQDDQSTIPSALRFQKSMEVDSVGNYSSRLSHDMAETSMKPKKKKKPKYPGSQFEQGWQLDLPMLAEQRDQSKRRSENHLFESNGTGGFYEQPIVKKQKMMKQSAVDNAFDNVMTGSIPSPMASQSISNPKKILKIFNGREGGRKTKSLKTPSVLPGSGSSWSQFEDQALVVLVHDMGPNWELVSDAINSILQFKCIYRKSTECKERHKVLMDKTANDGADSAEDSGSSQSYPSTLPGIPKGSARQLFQRLQGPVEEDVIREHFSKIIQIGQKQRHQRIQSESQDLKQMAVHSSHFVALSQVCPNNLNGVVLTPLDLCEEPTANADILLPLNYQGSHGNTLAVANQGSVASALTTSGAYSSLQGSCGPVLSPNLLLPSAPLNASARDGRYNAQRPSTSLSDDQHRSQQYGQALPSRNIQQAKLSVPGSVSNNDRGIRAFPNGNNIGIPPATNRSLPVSRPAFQGLAGPPAMNPSSMLSSGLVGTPGSGNLHVGSNSGQGTPLMRPRETLHTARQPGNNLEHQRQMMVPEMQMQVAQGNSHGISPVNGVGSPFSSQTTSPVSTFSAHSQHQHQIPTQPSPAHNRHQNPQLQGTNHATGPQSPAYAIRLAKERQLQQRYMHQHQQQQLASSGSLMPHVQPQPQLPLSSALQNSAQVPLQSPSRSVSSAPLTPSSPINPITPAHAQKIAMQPHALVRNAQSSVGGLTNQISKQRQRQMQQQQFQQSGRQHPQQRQSTPTQVQAKVPKGGGRGNAMAHQNLQNESSHLNGISMAPGSFVGEKELMRGQGLPSATNIPAVQQSKPLASQALNHPQLPQQTSSDTLPAFKQLQQQQQQQQQAHPHSDSGSQVQILPVPPGQKASSFPQPNSSTSMASNHLEVQQPQLTNKRQFPLAQSIGQRMLPPNQVAHEPLIESQIDNVKGETKPVSNSFTVGTSKGMPQAQASRDSAGSPQILWPASDPLYEAGIMSATGQMGRGGNLTYSGPARSESLPSVSQGLGQRQISEFSAPHGQGAGVAEEQWQQQPAHLKRSSGPIRSPQQQFHSMEQVSQLEQKSAKEPPLHSQPHHQTSHLLASQGNSCIRHTNSEVE